jgi:hypothetical protein
MKKILSLLFVFYMIFMAAGCIKQGPSAPAPTPNDTQTIIALSFTPTLTHTITLTATITPTGVRTVKKITVITNNTPTVTPTYE